MPTLMITRAQGNLMLEALAERPFKQVFEVIGTLNRQAGQFGTAVGAAASEAASEAGDDVAAQTADAQRTDAQTAADHQVRVPFAFSNSHLRLTLDALADLPYRRVQPLLQDLHAQLAQQAATSGAGD